MDDNVILKPYIPSVIPSTKYTGRCETVANAHAHYMYPVGYYPTKSIILITENDSNDSKITLEISKEWQTTSVKDSVEWQCRRGLLTPTTHPAGGSAWPGACGRRRDARGTQPGALPWGSIV